jgi:HEAT repeat protein
LRDKNKDVKRSAASVLEEIKNNKGIEFLIQALNS